MTRTLQLKLGGAAIAMAAVVTLVMSATPTPPAQAQSDDPLSLVDHYRCYDVEQREPHIESAYLRDQFLRGDRRVGKIQSICAPVTKRHNGQVVYPNYPALHLVCFEVTPNKDASAHVEVRNQFGIDHLRVYRDRTLCVPSLKKHL